MVEESVCGGESLWRTRGRGGWRASKALGEHDCTTAFTVGCALLTGGESKGKEKSRGGERVVTLDSLPGDPYIKK